MYGSNLIKIDDKCLAIHNILLYKSIIENNLKNENYSKQSKEEMENSLEMLDEVFENANKTYQQFLKTANEFEVTIDKVNKINNKLFFIYKDDIYDEISKRE